MIDNIFKLSLIALEKILLCEICVKWFQNGLDFKTKFILYVHKIYILFTQFPDVQAPPITVLIILNIYFTNFRSSETLALFQKFGAARSFLGGNCLFARFCAVIKNP